MDFKQLCKNRYSVRSFSNLPIEKEKLDYVLDCGRIAPTAKNNQPVRILILQSKYALEKAKQCSPCTFNSPCVLIFCTDTDLCFNATDGSRTSADIDATLLGSQVMLACTEQGLGSCFVLLFDVKKTKELFDLPKNIKPIFYLPIGYPAEDAIINYRHNQRHSIEEISKIL